MKHRVTLEVLFKTDPTHNGSIPLLTDTRISHSRTELILLKKIEICKVVFDHSNTTKNMVDEIEFKRQNLLEISEFIKQDKCQLSETVLKQLFTMLSLHIFRGLPSSNTDNHTKKGSTVQAFASLETDEEKIAFEPSWPHLNIVYDILLKLLSHVDAKSSSKELLLDKTFILRLLDQFDSEDPRERDILKTIFHKIYGKFTCLRSFMRNAVNNVFLHFVFESEKHNGIGELLEVLGSIINGFMVPLKEEHKKFLMRVLIPLHKPKCIQSYYTQLHYCVCQFVQKDSTLADVVIRGLIKYWPVTNCQKEVLLLGELEEVLEYTEEAEFSKVAVPLARVLGRCLNSSHSQVAERALYMWNNECFVNLVSTNMEQMLPFVVVGIQKNIKEHWNHSIQDQTLPVKKMLEEMEPELFQKCLDKLEEEESKMDHSRKRREYIWKKMEMMATLSSPPRSIIVNGTANGGLQNSFMSIRVN